MNPTVFLVGAGPGNPDLLTVKALRTLLAAEVVVYDRLVSDEIMALIPRGVPKIYAGKSCRHKTMSQSEINDLLVTLAQKYQRVVRLKGGDPFLFGRGGEEALALKKKGIDCEIIPGITSAQGCAAAAGIPLTHRGLATGVRFITGHRMSSDETGTPLALNWQSLTDIDTTLVVYMGLVNMAEIVENLLNHGLPASTPAAIIERGTTKAERLFRTSLSQLNMVVEKYNISAPSLIIIGKVAALNVSAIPIDTPQSQTSAHPQSQAGHPAP